MKNIVLNLAAIVASLAFITVLFTNTQAQTRNVEKEAKRFHEELKSSLFTEIYTNASKRLREKFTEKEFVEKLKKDVAELGEIRSIESTGFPPPNPVSELAKDFKNKALVFLVTGTKSAHYEVLIWDLTDKKAKLAIYNTDFSAEPVSKK